MGYETTREHCQLNNSAYQTSLMPTVAVNPLSADELALVSSISVNPGSENGENHGGALVCNINNQSNNSLAMHVSQPPSFTFHSSVYAKVTGSPYISSEN